jgi:hypothetical protein
MKYAFEMGSDDVIYISKGKVIPVTGRGGP